MVLCKEHSFERDLCLLKEITEGTYKTKHAEAARLDYTTKQIHIDTNMNKYRPSSKPKLRHARASPSVDIRWALSMRHRFDYSQKNMGTIMHLTCIAMLVNARNLHCNARNASRSTA
jgi:hypothetical protein